MGASTKMVLVNIEVMCSAVQNGEQIRWQINLLTERESEDNLVDSATCSDASDNIRS